MRLVDDDGTGYSEVHHIRPLGPPHDGPDESANMLVLCPNHQADFDNDVVQIDTESWKVEHPFDTDVDETTTTIKPDHTISEDQIQYHNENICQLQ